MSCSCLLVHRLADHVGHHLLERLPVAQPERIGLARGLPDGRIACGRALVRPHKDILEKIDAVQLVNAKDAPGVGIVRHIHERDRCEVAAEERDIGRKTRDALVHVLEGLEIWQLHHDKEGLLERILDRLGLGQQLVEAFVEHRRNIERMVDRAADADRDLANAARSCRIGQQVLRQQGMQVENGIPVEGDVLGGLHQELDGCLVIEDHLRVGGGLALGRLTGLDEALRVEQGIGVALKPAGVPRQVDEQPIENALRIGPGARVCGVDGLADRSKLRFIDSGEIARSVRLIVA